MGFQRKRADANQPQIVSALRAVSASVAHTHTIGKGFPDIVVGIEGLSVLGNKQKILDALKDIPGIKIIEGVNLLVEIKDGSKSESARKLTPDEQDWHFKWRGQICIVSSEEEAVTLLSVDEKTLRNNKLRAGIFEEEEKSTEPKKKVQKKA